MTPMQAGRWCLSVVGTHHSHTERAWVYGYTTAVSLNRQLLTTSFTDQYIISVCKTTEQQSSPTIRSKDESINKSCSTDLLSPLILWWKGQKERDIYISPSLVRSLSLSPPPSLHERICIMHHGKQHAFCTLRFAFCNRHYRVIPKVIFACLNEKNRTAQTSFCVC